MVVIFDMYHIFCHEKNFIELIVAENLPLVHHEKYYQCARKCCILSHREMNLQMKGPHESLGTGKDGRI